MLPLSTLLQSISAGTTRFSLNLDFSSGTLPSGLTYSRSGAQIVQVADTAAASVAANAPAYETRDGWAGLWTHPEYTNDLTADLTSAPWTRLNVTPALNSVTAPDGTLTAAKTVDTNAAANGAVYNSGITGARYQTLWVRDDAVSPPTGGPGSLTGTTSLNISAISTSLLTGTSWRRIETAYNGTSVTAYCVYVDGAQFNASFTPSSTGGVDMWGWMSTVSNTVLPIAPAGVTVGATSVQMSPAQAAACVDGGALDVEWIGLATWRNPAYMPTGTLWALDGGNHKLVMTGSTLELWISGVKRLTATMASYASIIYSKLGNALQVRCWWNPNTNSCGIQATVNGVYNQDVTGTTTGGALTAPADGYIGSLGGASSFAAVRHYRLRALKYSTSYARAPRGACLGDSTMGYPGGTNTASYMPVLLRAQSAMFDPGIFCPAISGNTTAAQLAFWNSAPAADKLAFDWVYLQTGLNDFDPPTKSVATLIAGIQALVTAVRGATKASCKIIIGQMIPFASQENSAHPGVDGSSNTAAQQLVLVNTAIAGGGGSPITGVDARITSYYTTLDNGSGDLQTQYRAEDGYHENDAARQVIATALNAALTGLGLVA